MYVRWRDSIMCKEEIEQMIVFLKGKKKTSKFPKFFLS
jgi:hypothetical protein